MAHHQNPDHIITANLHAAASRLAGWNPPTGETRARAVAELREIATIHPKTRHQSPHQSPAVLRADLLAEVAGILYGTAPTSHPQAHHGAAELLMEAGADRTLIDQWIEVGRQRAARGGPPFSRAQQRRR